MNRTPNSSRLLRAALISALATSALSGCSTKAPRADLAASKAQSQLEKGKVGDAIANAEQAVASDPRNASYRAVLASAYMEAGRFQSAATTYDDAMKLGDHSPRTALSLALAKIASGDMTGAQAILYDWRDDLDVSDLGLATSLAGAPQRGVQILSDALRGGESTPKIRQNLAYSYAMMGDWRSARLMASEDLPAAKVDERLGEWASLTAQGQHQARVAALVGAPVRADSGQPQRLALSNSPTAEQLAAEASALVPVAQNGELPPAADYDDYNDEVVRVANSAQPRQGPNNGYQSAAELPATSQPGVNVDAYGAPVVRPENFEQAFAAPAPRGGTVGEVAAQALQFVSRPVVQKLPARYGATGSEEVAAQDSGAGVSPSARGGITAVAAQSVSNVSRALSSSPTQADAPVAGLVQLGSFASEQGARRGWGIFSTRWPSLSNYQMVITKARVDGRLFWRVSAGGYKGNGAQSMCNQVKAKGYDCFAWAEGRPLPGALTSARLASR